MTKNDTKELPNFIDTNDTKELPNFIDTSDIKKLTDLKKAENYIHRRAITGEWIKDV